MTGHASKSPDHSGSQLHAKDSSTDSMTFAYALALTKPRLPRCALRDAKGHGVWLRPDPGTNGYDCSVPKALV